jgi:hypothetical protein
MGEHRWVIGGGRHGIRALVCWAVAVATTLAAEPEGPAEIPAPASAVKVEVDGTATPGSRLRLHVAGTVRPSSHYLWYQMAGPPVELNGRTEPELKVMVPQGADELVFLLVIGDARGLQEASVTIPVIAPPGAPAEPLAASGEPRADAGDDQIGLVGRRITLNGSASTPPRDLDYRWIQVGGPETVPLTEAGRYVTFTPRLPGRYRFGLFVAHENRISPPDYVSVDVGQLAAAGPAPAPSAPAPAPAGLPTAAPPLFAAGSEFDAVVAAALAGLDDAPTLAGPLAEAFEATAARLDLYRTCGEFLGEFSRRVDVIISRDPARRARWNASFFEPLTRAEVAQALTVGLDLRTQDGFAAPLTDPQRQELRRVFQNVAKRLWAGRATR